MQNKITTMRSSCVVIKVDACADNNSSPILFGYENRIELQ